MAPPKLPKNINRHATTIAVVGSVLREVAKLVRVVLEKEPRTCPKCSYRMVNEVSRVSRGRHRDPKRYWRCAACARRYKSLGEGPFLEPSDTEWQKYVPVRFPR